MATITTHGFADGNQGPYLLKRIKVDGREGLQSFISKLKEKYHPKERRSVQRLWYICKSLPRAIQVKLI